MADTIGGMLYFTDMKQYRRSGKIAMRELKKKWNDTHRFMKQNWHLYGDKKLWNYLKRKIKDEKTAKEIWNYINKNYDKKVEKPQYIVHDVIEHANGYVEILPEKTKKDG